MIKQLFIILAIVFIAQSLKPSDVVQTQLWFDNQLVNHDDPLSNATFSQRYWVIDQFYKPKTGPVILYICGEYTCPGLPEERLWPAEIAQMYGGLILVLEHRYYGESLPFGSESLEFDKMNLLTLDQALSDLAYFIRWVKKYGVHKVQSTSPWFTIGGSYPGAMSAWFRYKYPHLTVGAIASSAVVNAITDFYQFDEQIRTSANLSGEWCSQAIHDLNFNAQKQLEGENAEEFLKNFNATHVDYGQFLFYYADIFVEKIQYGERTWLCNNLQGKTLEEQNQWVIDLVNEEGITVDGYASYYLKDTKIDKKDPQSSRQWLYQYCTQFGWFQTPPKDTSKSMRGTWVNLTMYDGLCQQSFENHKMWPTVDRINNEYGAKKLEAFNIVMTDGVEDPWKWAGILKTNDKNIQAVEIVCEDCAHCVDLYTPRDDDAYALKAARELEIEEISRWIYEYNQKYGYDYTYEPIEELFNQIRNQKTQQLVQE
ncbi:hypothetical protein PPERSA_00984 [Pseudocohnilembus persalinus]|uniref:Serine carboxypeptidase S28 family protein n=1 Tax=Pseudocohnilembus persalinus TaxID=266149 RepID=A0A0V0R8L4_PSEPJ|nr:hypothetical protein PPERSA_00984 [Pseudocohnilembus persalinus]|eukprot:KRX10814.1 hypothetical protein PPERSA_00984 [Pseudocohnilembus persalinus]